MKCYAITHPGLVRPDNEDSFFIPESGEPFAMVCDGMGATAQARLPAARQ